MLKNETCFIVGAGASAEIISRSEVARLAAPPTRAFKFGKDFRNELAKRLDIKFDTSSALKSGDSTVWGAAVIEARQTKTPDRNVYRHAAVQLSEALTIAPSIDHLLHTHRGNERMEIMGKLAIVHAILAAERDSKLWEFDTKDGRPEAARALLDTWYPIFSQLLSEGVELSNVAQIFEKCSIICFNYDRCVEQFLWHALQMIFAVSEVRAAEIMHTLKIFHPYGSIGRLPWQGGDGAAVEFGENLESPQLLDAAKGIRTFTQSELNADVLTNIRSCIADAHTHVFLGFAFYPQNMDLLFAADRPCKTKRFIATALGLSKSDCSVVGVDIRNRLRKGLPDADGVLDSQLTCSRLVSEYRRSLSM